MIDSVDEAEETSPLVSSLRDRMRSSSSADLSPLAAILGMGNEREAQLRSREIDEETTRGIKLGLGDFVFYTDIVVSVSSGFASSPHFFSSWGHLLLLDQGVNGALCGWNRQYYDVLILISSFCNKVLQIQSEDVALF